MQRVGIMGGTFNPIHNGHIMLAREAYEQFHLNSVLVMPNKLPVYKDTKLLLSSEHRKNMVQLAIQDYPYMVYSDIELEREGNTYTIDTLNELHKNHPEVEYYFIMGGDSLVHFHEWNQYEKILKEAVLLCARRGDADYETLEQIRDALLEKHPDARIEFLHTDLIDISSSELRDMIQEKKDISKWIPESVMNYMKKEQLYTN